MTAVYPPYSPTKSLYDEGTVWGRFRHFLRVTDPRTLLVTNEEIKKNLALLRQYDQAIATKKPIDFATDAQLWRAKQLKDSAVNSATEEIIFRPFRMAGYMPYGLPIVVFCLLPATANSLALTALAQTINQSHNAAVNWCNRSPNKHQPDPAKDIIRGYAAAVTTAVTISLGAQLLVKRARVSERTRYLMRLFIPFPAIACASVTNMTLMRLPELQRGIPVFDNDTGKEVGVSKMAAKIAIVNTAFVRFTLVTCCIFVPQLLYSMSEKALLRKPVFKIPVQTFYTAAAFGLAVPLSLSLFTRTVVVNDTDLEPAFKSATPRKIRFDKGL